MPHCDENIELNIHGYKKTMGFGSYNEWLEYATKKLSFVKDRITIKDFLKRNQFINTSRDNNPVSKIVNDFKKDPMPGVSSARPLTSNSFKLDNRQRREFAFRERILQGYPNYTPDRIGWGDTNSKVIAGFVTVGDGIFSGIPPHHDISLNKEETRRQAEYGYGRVTGKQLTPTGLCFIQDETAGVGIHVGTDVRFLWHPKLYGNLLANASVSIDQMHTGATVIPKSDYRQFLRVGDFVIIEMGIRLNYWNSLLGGNELYNWESLVGYGELYDRIPFVDVYVAGGESVKVSNKIMAQISPQEFPYEPPKDKKGKSLHEKIIKTPPNEFTDTNDKPAEEGVRNVIDHPWSTGTPIPVNSGMPFIMTEDFAVDSTDRRMPFPTEIKTNDIRDLKGDGTNNGSSLKGQLVSIKNLRIIIPEDRWTLVPEKATDSNGNLLSGGIYSSSIDLTAPVLSRNSNPPLGGAEESYRGEEFEWPIPAPEHLFFNDESHQRWVSNGINFLFDLPQSVVLKYFPETNPPKRFDGIFGNMEITSSNHDLLRYREQLRLSGTFGGFGIKEPIFPEHLNGDYKYWTHNYQEVFGVDPSNTKIEMFSVSRRKGPSGFPDKNEWSTPPQNLTELAKFSSNGGFYYSTLNTSNDEGWAIASDESNARENKPFYVPNGARYTLRRDDKSGNITYNLGQTLLETDFGQFLRSLTQYLTTALEFSTLGSFPILTTLSGLLFEASETGATQASFWDIFEFELDKIVENSWPDKIADYSRMGIPYYTYGKIKQPFPISIDAKDGGYWFTDPNIPKPIKTPTDRLSDRTVGDISRHDPNNFQERQALTGYINRYENYKNEVSFANAKDRHPIDYSYRYYEDIAKTLTEEERSKIQFLPNKVYYAADENGIVIPIRINANTEIARFRVPVPTGLFDISGIAWQYSSGQPGLEWEREGYMMQIWPRFLSDITKRKEEVTVRPPVIPPTLPPNVPEKPTPPVRLPDITLDLGDSLPLENINELDCDRISFILEGNNRFNRRMGSNEPIQGCEGLQPGQEMYIIVTSNLWYGLTRTFYFRKDKDGNCTCLLVPRGTNLNSPNFG